MAVRKIDEAEDAGTELLAVPGGPPPGPDERRLEAVSGVGRERLPLMVEPEFLLAALLAAGAFYVAVAPRLLLAAAVGAAVGSAFLVLLWRRPGQDAPIAGVYAASAGAMAYSASGGDVTAGVIVAALVGIARLAEGWRRRRALRPGRKHDPYA